MIDVSEILPNLLVGTCPRSPDDIDHLKRAFDVTAVLNVQTDDDMDYWGVDWPRLESHYQTTGIDVRRVPVQDFDPDDVRRNLPKWNHIRLVISTVDATPRQQLLELPHSHITDLGCVEIQ
jgi:hypothetical protein